MPRVPVVAKSLTTGSEIEFRALLDTGADVTILDLSIASHLGIGFVSAQSITLAGIGGGFVQGHIARVSLFLLGEPALEVQIPVAFLPDIGTSLDNLIGRDVLQFIDLGLEHSKRTGYLGRTT